MRNESRKNRPTTGNRDAKGRFTSGNTGRPKGAKHRTTRAVEQLLDGEAETITQKVIDEAKAGDMTALRLVLERIAPARREPSVSVDLPDVTSANDLPAAVSAVLRAVANGECTPGEAERLSRLIREAANALEVHDLEQRIQALEANQGSS